MISSVHDDGFCDEHDFLYWEMNCEHLLIFHSQITMIFQLSELPTPQKESP